MGQATRTAGLGVVALFAAAGTAAAAPPVAIYTNIAGDPTAQVPGMAGSEFQAGTTTRFDRPFLSPNGKRWIMSALLQGATATTDEIMMVGNFDNGTAAVIGREGDLISAAGALGGELWGVFKTSAGINDAGQFCFGNNTSAATTTDDILVSGTGAGDMTVIRREGTQAEAYPVGYNLGIVDAAHITADGDPAFWSGTIAGTGVPTNTSALYRGSARIAQSQTDTPSGQLVAPAQSLRAFTTNFRMSADGSKWIYSGLLNGPTASDAVLVVNGTTVAQESRALPQAGASAATVVTISYCTMGRDGDWIARFTLSGGDDAIVHNNQVVAKKGDPIFPASTENWSDTAFSATYFSIAVNGAGDYIVGGLTSNPDTTQDAVLVLNGQRVALREGDLVDVPNVAPGTWAIKTFNNDDLALTDSGYLYFLADIAAPGAATAANQALLKVRVYCGLADVGSLGGTVGRDNQLTVDDIVVFLQGFFGNNPAVADVAKLGGGVGRDGQLSVDDVVVFLQAFFAGC